MEVRGYRSEMRDQMSEVGDQQPEDRSPMALLSSAAFFGNMSQNTRCLKWAYSDFLPDFRSSTSDL